jgi:signal transduction histidine kinase/HAMP domain-containing protein
MRRLLNSLAFKVGGIIIVTQILILAVIGYVYISRFYQQIDEQAEQQVQIPGTLMSAGLLSLESITDQEVMRELLGEELVEGLVVGANRVIFFASEPEMLGQVVDEVLDTKTTQLFRADNTGETQRISEGQDTFVTSIKPIYQADGQTARFFVYVKIKTNQAEAEKADLANLFAIGSLASLALTSLIVFIVFNTTIFTRISRLLQVLRRIEQGEMSARLTGKISTDEIGVLQHSVNQMASKREEAEQALLDLNEDLENRVTVRTRDLEIAAKVSRQITTMIDINELLPAVVESTLTSFGLYYAAVFLYDASNQKLRILAGTGSAGEHMKAEKLEMDIHGSGLVPKAARLRETILVNAVQQDPDYLFTEYLPDTRSEVALPMLISDHLIGVLDLQAAQVNRFSAEDVRVMISLAEQTAIAIRNAQLYAEVQQSLQVAEESNRVKSQFLAAMSHELRTPLNAILNFSQFVATGMVGDVTPQQVDMLNKVVSSGKHLLSLINDVLDISKIESGALKLFVEPNIHLITELKAVEDAGRALLQDKDVEITSKINGEIPLMTGDRRRIRQVMLNLVSNACKFTQQGHIELELSATDSEIIFIVRDTGSGIDSKDFELIFETFRQTETGLRQGEGTGLGLPISRRLTEAHGGRLWLESELGKGSCFYVAFPIEAEILKPLLKAKEVSNA